MSAEYSMSARHIAQSRYREKTSTEVVPMLSGGSTRADGSIIYVNRLMSQ